MFWVGFFLQEVYQGMVTNRLLTELVFVLNLFCHFLGDAPLCVFLFFPFRCCMRGIA